MANPTRQNTLHLVILVGGTDAQVEDARRLFSQGSIGWNDEHRASGQFIDIMAVESESKTTAILVQETDRYHLVYGGGLDDSFEFSSEDSQAIAREQKLARKRRNDWQPSSSYRNMLVREYLDYQPSRNRGISDKIPQSEPTDLAARFADHQQAKRMLERGSLSYREFDWVRYAQTTAVLIEDRFDRMPLQDFTDQRPKHYRGYKRRGQLKEAVATIVQEMVHTGAKTNLQAEVDNSRFVQKLIRRLSLPVVPKTTPEPETPQTEAETVTENGKHKESNSAYFFRAAVRSGLPHTPNDSVHYIHQPEERRINYDPRVIPLPPVVRPTQTLW